MMKRKKIEDKFFKKNGKKSLKLKKKLRKYYVFQVYLSRCFYFEQSLSVLKMMIFMNCELLTYIKSACYFIVVISCEILLSFTI
jgi:hypothetical protein